MTGPAPGKSRVYAPHGAVAHLTEHPGSGYLDCRPLDGPGPVVLGTGSQAEYDHAATLPLCKVCAAYYARYPQATP